MEQNQIKETKHGPDNAYLATKLNIIERDIIRAVNMQSKDFEDDIEASMDNLELEVDATFPTDSESEAADDHRPSQANPLHPVPRPTRSATESRRCRTNSSSSTDSSISQTDQDDGGAAGAVNAASGADPFRSQESLSMKLFLQPILTPFPERRRLSQCKEEDEEEVIERAAKSAHITGGRHKFTVTKTKLEPRAEAQHLSKMTAKQNAATIHFPCSSVSQRSSLQEVFFSPQKELNAHMDRRYFDTSLVEIRSTNTSTKSLNKFVDKLDGNVWVPRKNSGLGLDVSLW